MALYVEALADGIADPIARNLTQTTENRQPLYIASDPNFNGQPSMDFNGTSHRLSMPADIAQNVAALAWMGVFRLDVVGSNTNRILWISTTGAASPRFALSTDSSSRFLFATRRLDADSVTNILVNDALPETLYLATLIADYASNSALIRLNGSQVGSASPTWAGTTSDTASASAQIGALGSVTFLDGQVGASVFWRDKIPTAPQIAASEALLADYYGITLP